MGFKSISLGIAALVLSTSVNASVLNTLNGVDYEWLELTATAGLSRDQVEVQIGAATVGDALYGYEYASRALVEELLLSYLPWDGISGWRGSPTATAGIDTFIDDFGQIATGHSHTATTLNAIDGYSVPYDYHMVGSVWYGETQECNGLSYTCRTIIDYLTYGGNTTGVLMHEASGFDASTANLNISGSASVLTNSASFLVKPVATVPVPAAVWLFGSGLLGLVGVARRKSAY
jgi:hypothetical protein